MTNRKPAERKGKVLLIDASAMSTLMKKNLGKKRREFTPDCVERITKAYAEFQSMEWKENPEGKGGRVLKAKVFDREHFFYRRVTIERPLRMRFQIALQRWVDLGQDAALSKLAEEQRILLSEAVNRMDTDIQYLDAESFRSALRAAADKAAKELGLTGKAAKLGESPRDSRRLFGLSQTATAVV